MSKNIQGNFKEIQGLFKDKTTYFEIQGLFKDNLKIQGLFKGCANHASVFQGKYEQCFIRALNLFFS